MITLDRSTGASVEERSARDAIFSALSGRKFSIRSLLETPSALIWASDPDNDGFLEALKRLDKKQGRDPRDHDLLLVKGAVGEIASHHALFELHPVYGPKYSPWDVSALQILMQVKLQRWLTHFTYVVSQHSNHFLRHRQSYHLLVTVHVDLDADLAQPMLLVDSRALEAPHFRHNGIHVGRDGELWELYPSAIQAGLVRVL